MKKPKGFENPDQPNYVGKLNKAIYGLKQEPRAWYTELTNFLIYAGFRKTNSDHSLFTLHSHNTIIFLLVYEDDIVITGNNLQTINNIKSALSNRFSLKDLGPLHFFLGLEVLPQLA